MKDWFNNLDTRERVFLITGAAALSVFFIYLVIWQPLSNKVADLDSTVGEQRDTIQWMLDSAGEVRALQGIGSAQKTGLQGRSLLAVVDNSARGAGLAPALKRVEPDGSDAVRVWLEKASFDKLITWIAGLSRTRGVTVRAITIEREDTNGLVNSRVTLMEPPDGS